MRQHASYPRIHVDGFDEGPVPEDVYRDVLGSQGAGFLRARQFEDRVLIDIDAIANCRTGRMFLDHLQQVGGQNGIRIQPASLFPRDSLGMFQEGVWPGRTRDAYARSAAMPSGMQRGTGFGSSVVIGMVLGSNRCGVAFGRDDAVLLHELIHGMRATSGTQQHISMPQYDEYEEFAAITLTNLYLSELRLPLRGGHECQPMQMTLAEFRRIFTRYLDRLWRETTHRGLYTNLGSLPENVVPWNPFRR